MPNLPQFPRVTEVFGAPDVFSRLAGESGAGYVGFKQNLTGATVRTMLSKASDIIHVKDFGAVCDGVTDDAAAIQRALDNAPSGACVFMEGTARVATGITIPARKSLVGLGGLGSDTSQGYTEILGDLALTPIVTMDGGVGSNACGLVGVSIRRADGTVPSGSVSLLIKRTDSPLVEDVYIVRGAIAVKATGQLGINLTRLQTTQITETHLWIEGVAQLDAINCKFGRNGVNEPDCNEYVRIKTSGDTLRFTNCQFNTPDGAATRAVYFDTYSDINGIMVFTSCHFEGVGASGYFAQTGTSSFKRLAILGCTLNSANPFCSTPAAFFDELRIVGCPSIAGTLPLNAATGYSVVGNKILGAVTLTAGSGTFTGNALASTLTVTGACAGVVASNNVLTTAAAITNTATGQYAVFNNPTADATLNAAQDGVGKGSTTPTPISGSGTFTSATASVNWTKVMDRILIDGSVVITTNGTAATDVQIPLPFTPAKITALSAINDLGIGLTGDFVTNGRAYIFNPDSTYPGGSGRTLYFSGHYRPA
jgi:hypothetical protein